MPTRRSILIASILGLALIAVPGTAGAQLSIDPTSTPVNSCPIGSCWIDWMALGGIIIGGVVFLMFGASYLRFAPRFFKPGEEEEVPKLKAPPPTPIQYRPPAREAVAVGAPASAAQAPATAPAEAPAPAAEAPAPAAEAPAPAAEAAAAAPPPDAAPTPPRPKGEPIELDQATLDKVLEQELAKGTDRRVAEGRARSAAFKAAREKAGG